MDPFTLKKLAGHTDLNTTMRYVRLNDDDVRAATEKARRGPKNWHSADLTASEGREETSTSISSVRN